MNKSESIATLAGALAKAQGKMRNASKDGENPTFHKQYATLAGVWDASREALSDNGLSIIQLPTSIDGKVYVETILTHASGEWISEKLEMTPGHSWNGGEFIKDRSPHGIGSAISYARRYSMAAMIGITQADDDGNAASARPDARQQQRERESETARTKPAAPIPTAHSNAPAITNWKDIVCHVGTETKGKTLGALIVENRKSVEFLANDWTPKRNGIAETNLKAGAKAALSATPAEAPTPESKAETPPAEEKPDGALLNKKDEALDAIPADWRAVKIRWVGKKSTVTGKTLGVVADSAAGKFEKALDGPALIRRLASKEADSVIRENAEDEKQDPEQLLSAIAAAVAETKAFDQPEWLAGLDADGLREEIGRRIALAGVTEEDADAKFTGSKLGNLADMGEGTMREVIGEWETFSETLKGAA